MQNEREGDRKCQAGLVPAWRGGRALGPSEVGVGGHSPTLGGTGSSQPPPQAGPGPIIGFSPGSSTLRGLKKKRKQPPRQLDMAQKPPGSLGSRKPAQEEVEGRECRGSVPRERDFRREGKLACSWASWLRWVSAKGLPGNPPLEGLLPWVQTQALGKMLVGRKMQAHQPCPAWAYRAV